MAKKVDTLSTLINARYFNWIREAILKHGNVNIQALSDKFNILAGNTYFRNFIKNKGQDYLGISGLTSILDECGYELKLIPVKKDDVATSTKIEDMTKDAFLDIREIVSSYAESVKRNPKKVKNTKPKVIKNASLINDSIMGITSDDHDDLFDDDDDDDLVVGTTFGDVKSLNNMDF